MDQKHRMSLYDLGERSTADSWVWQHPATLIHHGGKQTDFFISKAKETAKVLLAEGILMRVQTIIVSWRTPVKKYPTQKYSQEYRQWLKYLVLTWHIFTLDSLWIQEATISELGISTEKEEDLALPPNYPLTPTFLFIKRMCVEKMARYHTGLL